MFNHYFDPFSSSSPEPRSRARHLELPEMEQTHMVQNQDLYRFDRNSSIAQMPLPRTSAALSAPFYSPNVISESVRRLSTPTVDTQGTTLPAPKYLTRSFLQNDVNCQESSELRSLLGTIFSYSSRRLAPSTRSSEITAGFRYFMPNGRLAYEWIHFINITPIHYMQMIPPDVLQAYYDEHAFTPCSMKGWVDAEMTEWEIREAGQIIQQLMDDVAPMLVHNHNANVNPFVTDALIPISQTFPRKRKRDIGTSSEDWQPNNVFRSASSIPSRKRPRVNLHAGSPFSGFHSFASPADPVHTFGATPATSQSSLMDASLPWDPFSAPWEVPSRKAQPLATSLATMNRPFISQDQIFPRLRRSRQPPVIPHTWASQADPSFHTAAHAPGAPMFTAVSSIQAAPLAPVGVLQQSHAPTNPPSIPRNRQARFNAHFGPKQLPGTVTHRGKGNVLKAWSPARVRAFTDIQGYPAEQLPVTAISEFGDELSRNHTPKSIDLRQCPFPTTMEENLTYLTLATTINRELCARAKKNWTAQQMVLYVYWTHDLQHKGTYDRTKLQKQFSMCAQQFEDRPENKRHVPTASMSNISMDSGLTGDDKITHDFFLYDMGVNVVRHPTGHAAQMLTRVIEDVIQKNDRTVRLSQAAQYARDNNITVPAHLRMSNNLDVADKPDATTIATARAEYIRKFSQLP